MTVSNRLVALALATTLLAPAALAQDEPTSRPTPAEPVAAPAEPATLAPPVESIVFDRTDDDEDVKVTGASADTVVTGGRTVEVDVTAPDVFAGGETVTFDGAVGDNLFGAGRSVAVNGPVGGDAFLAGEELTVTADVQGDLYALAESITIPADVTVGGNVFFAGADFDLQGSIDGNLHGAGANFHIDGSVAGNAQLQAAKVEVGPDGTIGGTLTYTSTDEATIDGSVGGVDWTQKAPDWETEDADEDGDFGGAGSSVFFALAAMLMGGVLLGLFPRAITRPAELLETESPVALGVGFAVLLGVPVLAVFLAVFILPIPLSLLAMALYVPATFIARFVAAYALGVLVLRKMNQEPKPLGALLAGLFVLYILYAIPLVGGLVMLAATVLGLGAMFLVARRGQALEYSPAR